MPAGNKEKRNHISFSPFVVKNVPDCLNVQFNMSGERRAEVAWEFRTIHDRVVGHGLLLVKALWDSPLISIKESESMQRGD